MVITHGINPISNSRPYLVPIHDWDYRCLYWFYIAWTKDYWHIPHCSRVLCTLYCCDNSYRRKEKMIKWLSCILSMELWLPVKACPC